MLPKYWHRAHQHAESCRILACCMAFILSQLHHSMDGRLPAAHLWLHRAFACKHLPVSHAFHGQSSLHSHECLQLHCAGVCTHVPVATRFMSSQASTLMKQCQRKAACCDQAHALLHVLSFRMPVIVTKRGLVLTIEQRFGGNLALACKASMGHLPKALGWIKCFWAQNRGGCICACTTNPTSTGDVSILTQAGLPTKQGTRAAGQAA